MNELRPLGPQAMLAKLEQLKSQIEPPAASPAFEIPTKPPSLSGKITESGTTPMNPFGTGSSIKSLISPEMLQPMIERAAKEQGLDPNLLDSLVQAESNYDPGAISRTRAMGLTQLMPDTAKELGVIDPFDPAQNLRGGARYLAQMMKRFDGDLVKAVAAYNAGPGAVTKHGGIPPYVETQNYVERVMNLYRAKGPK